MTPAKRHPVTIRPQRADATPAMAISRCLPVKTAAAFALLLLGAGLACCSSRDLRDWSYHRQMGSLLDNYSTTYNVKQDYAAAVSIAQRMVEKSAAHGEEDTFDHRNALLLHGQALTKVGKRDDAVGTFGKLLAIYQRQPSLSRGDYIHGRATELLAALSEENE